MKYFLNLFAFFAGFAVSSCNTPPSGSIVNFNDYKLHVIDQGVGEPAVIFEGCVGCEATFYDSLLNSISRFTKVVSYDRAGIAFSTASPNQRTLPNCAKELHLLLEKISIKPPYILVGHSIGGFIIRYYAYAYPEEVAGLVFIDQPSEDWLEYIRANKSPETLIKFNKVFDPDQNFFKGVAKEELEMWNFGCDTLKGIDIPHHIPIRMLTSTQYGEFQQKVGYDPADMKKWAEMQARILEGLPDAKQIITEKSGHSIHETEPELVVNAIKELIDNYRRNTPKVN